ncbi:MAG: hypothetical protein L0215_13035 [Gemmataceae bacterium]|nr:hypothetical protein [Gemmataceae bacterium]
MATKVEEMRKLASAHYRVEKGITHIFHITGDVEEEARAEEPIKLLEVNRYTIPTGIMPLSFGPAPAHGIHYPSIIVEVTPDEFQRIKRRELRLPNGWTLGDLLPKPRRKS